MERCSVVEMRKNLTLVEQFKKLGIDFVPLPVFSAGDKKEKLKELDAALDKLAEIAEE